MFTVLSALKVGGGGLSAAMRRQLLKFRLRLSRYRRYGNVFANANIRVTRIVTLTYLLELSVRCLGGPHGQVFLHE